MLYSQYRFVCLLALFSCTLSWKPTRPSFSKILKTSAAITGIFSFNPSTALSREVASIAASGLVFKDTLKVSAFEDPKLKGVTIYLSDFDRPMLEDPFSDPTSTALGCALTGQIAQQPGEINASEDGEEVFEESRSLFFKQIRVKRIYDKQTNTAVYVSYSTRLDKKADKNKARFKSSLCAINLNGATFAEPKAPKAKK